jgi:hypothetical protein
LGQDVVTPRRTELYCAGDVIAYPILDPHSVSMLSPLTGTTMTLAHTGLGILKDSAFFAVENLGTVQQLKYEEDDFTAAIDLAITRLQLIELNRSLTADPSFRHLNAFETELLPRIAEALVIWKTSKEGEPVNALQALKQLGLSREHARMIAEMDTASLWKLLVESQQALLDQEFVEDQQGLLHPVERSSGRGNKPRPPFKTTELTKRALQTRLGGEQPVNLIGSRRSK